MNRFGPTGWIAVAGAAATLACGMAPRADLAARDWYEIQGSVFLLRSDAGVEALEKMARELELFIAVVRATAEIQIEPPRQPLHVYAIEDPELLGRLQLGPGQGIAGLHATTAHGNVILSTVSRYRDRTRLVLYHEFVHFLLARTDAYVPRWYHEGLADFLSSVRSRQDLITVGHVPQDRTDALEHFDALPLTDLLAPGWSWRNGEEVVRFYGTAWLFVHYLHTGTTGTGATLRPRSVDFLGRLAAGESQPTAFASAFATEPEVLDEALSSHLESVRAGHLRLLHLHAPDLAPAQPGSPEPASRAAVAADLAEVLLSYRKGWATDAAIEILESALALEPEDAPARAALAWARARRGYNAEAQRELARALAQGASSARVQLQAGRTRIAFANSGSRLERAELEGAREHLRRATSLDPELGTAWSELGATYARDDVDDPPAPGIEALERARSLLPADSAVHLGLGKLWSRAGDPARAREHLELVLQWSWAEKERDEAETLLDTLPREATPATGSASVDSLRKRLSSESRS